MIPRILFSISHRRINTFCRPRMPLTLVTLHTSYLPVATVNDFYFAAFILDVTAHWLLLLMWRELRKRWGKGRMGYIGRLPSRGRPISLPLAIRQRAQPSLLPCAISVNLLPPPHGINLCDAEECKKNSIACVPACQACQRRSAKPWSIMVDAAATEFTFHQERARRNTTFQHRLIRMHTGQAHQSGRHIFPIQLFHELMNSFIFRIDLIYLILGRPSHPSHIKFNKFQMFHQKHRWRR